jgi:hypothetical protein
LIAGLENIESGIDEVNIGGRLIDPKMVMASRNKNVAATTLGNLVACTGGGCNGDAGGLFFVDIFEPVFGSVSLP